MPSRPCSRPCRRLSAGLPALAFLACCLAAPVWAGNNLWTGGGPSGGEVREIAVHPEDALTSYAGTNLSGVWKTVDGGASWIEVNDGISFANGSNPAITDLAIQPDSPETILAVTSNRVFKTTDGGASWTDYALAGSGARIAIDPADPDIVYISGGVGIQKSTDGGETWGLFNNGLTSTFAYDVAVDPNLGNIVYAATTGGVFKSTNSAASWALADTGLFGIPQRIAIDSQAPLPGTLFAITSTDIFRSVDGAAGWNNLSTGLPSFGYRALVLDPVNAGTLYISAGDVSVYTSTDNGDAWTSVSSGLLPRFLAALALSPANPDRIYAANYAGVFATPDAGANWNDASDGLDNTSPLAIAFDPANADIIYTATYGSVYKSLDGGASWQRIDNTLPSLSPFGLTTDSLTGALYLASTLRVHTSTDGGASWTQIDNGLPFTFAATVAVDPVFSNILLAGTAQGIYRSTDTGANWVASTTGMGAEQVTDLEIDPLTRTNMMAVVAAFDDVLYRSTDGGATWGVSQTGITASAVVDVAYDRISPSTAYAATNGGMFRSMDGGATWTAINNGLSAPVTRDSVATSPDTQGTVYSGGNTGTYYSTDSGDTWMPMDDGVTPWGGREARTLALSALAPDTVHAGLYGDGVRTWTFGGPGLSVLPDSLTVAEPDGMADFVVRADTDPAADVAISLSASNGECLADPEDVVLNAGNRFETVTVAAIDDVVVDGTQSCDIVFTAAQSADPDYDGRDTPDVAVEVLDDDTAGLLVSPTLLTVSEPDGSDTFDITAQTPLIEDVMIDLTTGNDECSITPSQLVLTPAIPAATATVTAVDDLALDGTQACSVITAASASADPAYDGLDPANVSVKVDDNEVPGITVNPVTLDVDEGSGETFTLSADSIPFDDVMLTLATTSGECSLPVTDIMLTPGDISIEVTVLGSEDPLLDGTQACGVMTGTTASNDPNYDGLDPADVAVNVLDTTTPALVVTPTAGLVTDEDGGSDTFSVALNAFPSNNVAVPLASSDPGEGTPDVVQLIFTPGNALTPQVVTVTGAADGVIDPDTAYSIQVGPTSSPDTDFDDLPAMDVDAINLDTDDIVLIDGFEE